MSEKPILFSAPMVRAILNGDKTQTRRILRPQPPTGATMFQSGLGKHIWNWPGLGAGSDNGRELPRVRVAKGDTLWVRETWSAPYRYAEFKPRDMGGPCWFWADGNPKEGDWTRPMPSIHMPRWASRITLAVTDVRIQRLQDISEQDAELEGAVIGLHDFDCTLRNIECDCGRQTYRETFTRLWDTVNGDGAWEANPWVYALTFEIEAAARSKTQEPIIPAITRIDQKAQPV